MKIVVLIALVVELFGAPAFDGWRVFYNSDGTSFEAKPQGDHYLHWLQTKDGSIVKYNQQTKNFEYGVIKNNNLVTSGEVYRGVKKAPAFQKEALKIQTEQLFDLWRLKREQNRFKQPYK